LHGARNGTVPFRTAEGILVKDRSGRVVPSQVLKADVSRGGDLAMVEVAFLARDVPSAGYDTYYLECTPTPAPAATTSLRIDQAKLVIENEFVRVALDPANGAVASLVHKPSGRETLDGKRGAFPHFTGRPNPNLSLKPAPPARYDSATSKAQLDWVAKGPLLATLRAQHRWPYLTFETRVTVTARAPYVEVITRLLALVPPHSDAAPADIKEGYWASFAPAFEPLTVLRDYPFGVEATQKPAFHALTFVDLLGKDIGLLVLHPGTQWFRREEKDALSNLLVREWESHFTREYGWPLYAEYRHRLWPHAGDLSNADRLRAAAALARPLICRVGALHQGDLPPSKSFLKLAPKNVQLTAWRKKSGPGYELRVVENQGKDAEATVELSLPIQGAIETDLLGREIADVAHAAGRLTFPIRPWKIRTFELT
jgi:alpha-mannosidase